MCKDLRQQSLGCSSRKPVCVGWSERGDGGAVCVQCGGDAMGGAEEFRSLDCTLSSGGAEVGVLWWGCRGI